MRFALILGLRLDELYDLDKFFNDHSIPDGSAIHGKRNCFRLLGAAVDMALMVEKRPCGEGNSVLLLPPKRSCFALHAMLCEQERANLNSSFPDVMSSASLITKPGIN